MKSYGVTIQMKPRSAVLSRGTIYLQIFYKMKFEIRLEF